MMSYTVCTVCCQGAVLARWLRDRTRQRHDGLGAGARTGFHHSRVLARQAPLCAARGHHAGERRAVARHPEQQDTSTGPGNLSRYRSGVYTLR